MKTSVYLNRDRFAALDACGLGLLQVVDLGLAAAAAGLSADDLVKLGTMRKIREAGITPDTAKRFVDGWD